MPQIYQARHRCPCPMLFLRSRNISLPTPQSPHGSHSLQQWPSWMDGNTATCSPWWLPRLSWADSQEGKVYANLMCCLDSPPRWRKTILFLPHISYTPRSFKVEILILLILTACIKSVRMGSGSGLSSKFSSSNSTTSFCLETWTCIHETQIHCLAIIQNSWIFQYLQEFRSMERFTDIFILFLEELWGLWKHFFLQDHHQFVVEKCHQTEYSWQFLSLRWMLMLHTLLHPWNKMINTHWILVLKWR